ncbi:MAG TPA: Do family serine endopeptidase, partial [Woeseiaceae bacterium]
MSRWPFARRSTAVVTVLAAAVSVMSFSIASKAADRPAEPLAEPHAVFEQPADARSFADVVQQVSPAVVSIKVTQQARAVPAGELGPFPGDSGRTPFDDFFERFFGVPGMPLQRGPMQALGSGFLIDGGRYVVTNNHVIDGADKIVVSTQDGREIEATLVGTDPKTDIALLELEGDEQLPSVQFGDSDKARVGDWVLAIGNPFGLGGTATAGIISARGRDIQSGPYDDFLQIDAPINSGNSGGPVFDADGNVIGMNTAIFSPNGGNVGIGFAIPSRQIVDVVDALKTTGTVQRGWLGVQIQNVSEDMAASFSLKDAAGALVADVVDGSPADRAGVLVGDVILKFDGRKVDDARALSRIVAHTEPKGTVPVTVWRNGHDKALHVKMGGAQEETVASASGSPAAHGEELGLGLVDLTDEYRARLGLPDDYSGVVIAQVAPDSSAAEQGLR